MLRGFLTYGMLALLAYLAGLVYFLPAHWVWPQLKLNHVQLEGLAGSVWKGHASDLLLDGHALGQVDWQMAFWPLLVGRLAMDVELQGEGVNAQGRLSKSWFGPDVQIQALQAQLAGDAAVLRNAMPLNTAGRVLLRIEDAHYRPDTQLQASGRLSWQEAQFGLGDDPLMLGDLTGELAPTEQGVELVLKGRGGEVDVDADLSMTAQLQYRLEANLQPAGPLSAADRRTLSLLGVSNPRGGKLNYSGKL